MDPMTLPLSEVFGPTWQGEGPHCGRLCGFVRLGLCNLSCEWCDTPYTWDASRYDVAAECPDTKIGTILMRLNEIERDANRLQVWVLSGGEPMIHSRGPRADALMHLLSYQGSNDRAWHVETNGTITPPDWMTHYVRHWTISPKINTADPESKRIKADTLAWFAGYPTVAFKFVATEPADVDTVDALVRDHLIRPSQVWVMPEGTSPEAVIGRHRELAKRILDSGYNTTTRLQVLLWGDERGH